MTRTADESTDSLSRIAEVHKVVMQRQARVEGLKESLKEAREDLKDAVADRDRVIAGETATMPLFDDEDAA